MTDRPTGLQRIEVAAWIIGLVASSICWYTAGGQIALGVFLGAIFASVNFRLMIWSWQAYVDEQVAAHHRMQDAEDEEAASTPSHDEYANPLPRFLIKYSFLLAGLLVVMLVVKPHMWGFVAGLSNVIVAATLSPLLLIGTQSLETEA